MTRGTIRLGGDLVQLHQGPAFFNLVGWGSPGHVINFVLRPQEFLRCAVALQATSPFAGWPSAGSGSFDRRGRGRWSADALADVNAVSK